MITRLTLRVVALLIMGVLILGGVAGFWVLHTPAGTRWSLEQIAGLAGDRIQIEAPAGTWRSGITLGQLRYRDGETEAVLNAIAFRLLLTNLPARELFVEHLDIERFELRLPEAAEPGGPSTDLRVPLDVILQRGRIGKLLVTGEPDREIADLEVSAVWSGRRIRVARFSATGFGVSASAAGAMVLNDPIALAARISWAMEAPDGREWQGTAELEGDLEQLRLSHQLLAPFSIATTGTLALVPEPRVELVSTTKLLSYPVDGRVVTVREGEVTFVGWLEAYDVIWQGELATDGFPAVFTRAAGVGDTAGLRLSEARLEHDGNVIQARGGLSWSPDVAANLDVSLENLDPALLVPGWAGRLSGQLQAEGRITAAGFTFDIRDISIAGRLRERPLMLQGNLSGGAGELRFAGIRLASETNVLRLDGVYGERFDLTYQADIEDLGLLGPDWSGGLTASGTAAGTLGAPALNVEATARDLAGPDFRVQEARLSGRIGPDATVSTLIGTAAGIQAAALRVDRAVLEAAGALQDHQIQLNAGSGDQTLMLRLQGAWLDTRWEGQLGDSELHVRQAGRWRQTAAAGIRWAAGRLEVERLCWDQAQALVCVAGAAAPDQLALSARVDELSLTPVSAWLPPGVAVAGLVTGEAAVTGTPQAPALRFTAGAPGLDLSYSFSPEDDPLETAVRDVTLTGELDARNLSVDLTLTGSQGGDLSLDLALGDWRQSSARINGQLRASIPDVAFLSMLYTEVTDWAGALQADLAVAGRLDAPDVAGYVRLDGGRAALRRAGIELTDVQVEARPAGSDQLGIRASARSGEGVLTLDGGIQLDAAAGWPLHGNLSGDRFTALRLPGIDVAISPELTIAGARNTIRVSGQLAAPRAVVELKELPGQTIKISPDVIVHGRDQLPVDRPAALQFHTDVEVVLGDEVRFTGFGLRTQLGGRLALTSAPRRPLEGRGVVDITSGRFQAYGQNLEIQDGTLLFAGPLDDPTLDVTAVRRVDGTTVGVRVRGTGQAPVASIFSEPAMSEADALSYLVIGRPLAEATSAQGTNVTNAAVALGLQQAMPITDQLSQAVGLDELGLDPDNVDTGSVMAGKRITPDLYVRYSYGLFNRLGAVLLRYRLNSRLSLEARSAQDQSMDIIYTRERR
jgi:translocation and assembly module TamB